MDKIRNPFSPGAGSPPPELAGREASFEQDDEHGEAGFCGAWPFFYC